MRKYWLIGLAIVALILVYSNFALSQEDRAPKILINAHDFDFGEVKEGEIITHTYQVLNQGNEPLTIEKVKPG